jgi:hypothetical protein
MYIYIYPLLAPELLDMFYTYSEFKSLSDINRCPVNMTTLAQNTRALQMSPKVQNDDSLEKASNESD